MSAVISGTNGLLQSYDYQVLATAFSYTFAAGTQVLVINPAGTLATGTITMPASPADGMTITVESTQEVTALTMSGNGGTIVGPAVQLIPNQPLSWVYRLANTTWYPVYGGAGRATALVSGTAVASTSGTSIDFTGLPSWVKRVTVMLSGVSQSTTDDITLLLGTGATPTYASSGYNGLQISQAGGASGTLSTNFRLTNTAGGATAAFYGIATLVLITGNTWVCNSSVGNGTTAGANQACYCYGSNALGSTLTAIRIALTGAGTFDAGSINILYE
jgi:hypothetical protein